MVFHWVWTDSELTAHTREFEDLLWIVGGAGYL